MYNEEIAKFHSLVKRIQKEVYVMGHYEILNLEGASEKRLKVQGETLPWLNYLNCWNILKVTYYKIEMKYAQV